MSDLQPAFFPTPADFNDWLRRNHAHETELWVGYYKKDSGTPSITWPESVEEALCFGWIDGHRKSVDEQAYTVRFSPRRPGSSWSKANMESFRELEAQGRVHPAGRAAWEARKEDPNHYTSHDRPIELPPEYLAKIKTVPSAWEHYETLSPYVRRVSNYWVVSARREPTREKRLQVLIESCKKKKKIPALRKPGE